MIETIENDNKNADNNDAISRKTQAELKHLEAEIIKQFKERKDSLSLFSKLDTERLNYWKKISQR